MKALPIWVFKSGLGDCTNGGITSRYDRLLLVCDEGFIDIDENEPPENTVKLVERLICGRIYKHIEPIANPTHLGWMHGGNLAYSSDSRFPHDYPLCVHDRQETQEQYDALFD